MQSSIVTGLIVLGILLVVWDATLARRDEPVRRCPGPKRRWWAWPLLAVWPRVLFWRSSCGYDLRGQAADPAGAIVCPECGRRMRHRREWVTTKRKWRRQNTGLALVAVALAGWLLPPIDWRQWVVQMPSIVLMRIDPYVDESTSLAIHQDLADRFDRGEMHDEVVDRFIGLLIADLGDDDRVGNAETASERLRLLGDMPVARLQAALKSSDWQQRQIAASLLRENPWADVTGDLLRVTVEGMRDDGLPSGSRYTNVYNAVDGLRYIVEHAAEAEGFLIDGMRSNDEQERLLCAAAAGLGGRHDLLDEAFPILAEHLKDNDVGEDAVLAARGLAGFGPDIVPLLDPLAGSPDRQQRDLAQFLILRVGGRVDAAKLRKAFPASRIIERAVDATMLEVDQLRPPE